MTRGARNSRLLVEIATTIVFGEMVVMLVLPRLAPELTGVRSALFDVVLLAMLVVPVIVWRVSASRKRAKVSGEANVTTSGFARIVSGVVAIGLVLSAFAFRESSESIRAEARARFEKLAERTVSEIYRSINQPVYGLKGARGVYAASISVSRNEFKAYVESRDLPREFPGALGFGFIERVKREQLDAFIARERADDAPDFAVRSMPDSALADAPDLYIIKHIYPLEPNRPAWGYDVGGESVRREAVERAVRTGEASITGKIALVQDDRRETGFLYLVPVYRNGTSPRTSIEREDALVGLVYSPILLSKALAELSASSNEQVEAEIYDGESSTAGTLLYADAQKGASDQWKPSPVAGGFIGHYRLSVGGRVWSIAIRSTPVFDQTMDRHTPIIIGLIGIALTGMMAATFWAVGNSQRRAVGLAKQMTRDVKRLSMIAERTSNAVVITDAQQRIEWVNDGFTRVTGYTLDEVRGKVPGQFLQCDATDPEAVAKMRDAVAAGESCQVELLNKAKNGREYVVAIEIQPYRDEHGNVQGFMAIESDITERVRAREHIERQEALLRETGEAAGVGGWMIDLCDGTLIWSDQARQIFEVDAAYTPTREAMVASFPNDAARTVRDALERAATHADPFDLEVPLLTARSRRIWVRMVGRAASEHGKAVRLYGAIQDVTNQRAANIALAASEGRFRTLIEHAPAAIAMFDRDMRYVACSRQWLEEYNLLDRGDIIGKSHYEVFPDTPLRWRRIHEQVLRGSVQRSARDPFVRADGHTQWLQWEVRPWHTRDGAIAGMVMFTRDISELVAQENVIREQAERLDLTLRSAHLGTWDWNVITGSVAFSDIAQTMLGYEPGDWKPHVSAWEDLVHPDDRAHVMQRLAEHLEGRSTDYQCEHRLRRKDGTWAWVLDVGRVIERAADGQAIRAMGIHMDITVAREAAEAIKAAQRAAEAANRAKSEFLANMSHEIRTPMTAIVGYADLLMDPHHEATDWRDHVETIKRNGEHLLTIINDILDLSKIEAGKMSVESIPMDPAQILADVESLMRVRTKAKGITLATEYATGIPTTMNSDPVRFKQILVNLVGNAIKFTELGGIRIVARYDEMHACGASFLVSVIDTGIGMNQDQIERLFLAFTQGDTSTTRRFGGTGLGLRISKSLATMMGGDIEVSSTPNVGSTFTLRIPAIAISELARPVPVRAQPDATTDRSSSDATPGSGPLAGVRICFAEDGPDNQRLISFHLRKAGATVRIFENGRLALESLTTDGTIDGPLMNPPPCDLVLTDMQMPEVDGYSLARMLRAKGWSRPIVALTAHAMSGDAERCIEAGCDRYATKPIERDSLIAACRIDQGAVGTTAK